MKLEARVLLDLGNSETRVGVEVLGNYRQFSLSNVYAPLRAGYPVSKEYNNSRTIIFSQGNQCYAFGELVENEFVGQGIRPVAYEPKCEQPVTALTINLAFIKVVDLLSSDLQRSPRDIEWQFNVGVLVPATEHQYKSKTMEQLVRSVTSVTSVMPNSYTVPITINKVAVLPEGLVSYTSAMFEFVDNKPVVVPENKKFKQGYVLVMDIGAGTTDVALVKDGRFVSSTKESFKKGGNFVTQRCAGLIGSEYDYTPSNMSEVIRTATLHDGGIEHDISDILNRAKEQYVQTISGLIRSYIEGLNISLREVRGILAVGGGTLPVIRDSVVVSPSLSHYIIDFLKNLAPNVELVSLHGIDPRLSNLEGLHILCREALK